MMGLPWKLTVLSGRTLGEQRNDGGTEHQIPNSDPSKRAAIHLHAQSSSFSPIRPFCHSRSAFCTHHLSLLHPPSLPLRHDSNPSLSSPYVLFFSSPSKRSAEVARVSLEAPAGGTTCRIPPVYFFLLSSEGRGLVHASASRTYHSTPLVALSEADAAASRRLPWRT